MRKPKTTVKPKLNEKNESFFRKHFVQILSTIITFCTLIFTIYQGYKIRENNELSITPKIQFTTFNNYETGEYEVKMTNSGIGPAIVDDIIFKKNGQKEYSTKDLKSGFWFKIFEEFKIPNQIIYNNIYHFILTEGYYIPAKEEIKLITIAPNPKHTKDYKLTLKDEEMLMKIIANSKFYIKYHSIYKTHYIDSLTLGDLKMITFKK